MMINKKNCSLIVLLVLAALPRNSESIFSRLTKRSTDDTACQHSTIEFCSKIINDEKGVSLSQRFDADVSHLIQNHYKNATANCKVLLCVMTMYAVIVEGKKFLPNAPFINDEAFINVIKGSSLADCIDNKNNYNTNDSHTDVEMYTANISTIDDKSYTTDSSSNIDFNQFETATTQQDTQSIKSNEIDGSLNESKYEPRKGIIDILYTNENYTNAKSQYVNEQTDTELVEDNPTVENIAVVVNLGELETEVTDAIPPFYTYGENERFDLDVANKIGMTETTPAVNENTVSTSEFAFDSSLITSTAIPINLIDLKAENWTTSTASALSDNDKVDETKRILTFESSATPTSTTASTPDLSQVGNIIFQLLGEEGYNSFSCNLTTTSEDNTASYSTMYRRTNNNENASGEKIDFESFDVNALPKIPAILRDDKEIKFSLLEFRVFELCNFTSEDHTSQTVNKVSEKLTLCLNGISKLKMRVHGKTKLILEQYAQDLHKAARKINVVQGSRMKIIKVINLTDYLSSTIKDSDIPKDMKSNFYELKEFLLVELKNEDLYTFHPDSNQKDAFMRQLFDFLIQSKIVDNKKKKLLEMFRKFIRIVS